MPLPHQSPAEAFETIVEYRLRERLAPWTGEAQKSRHIEGKQANGQFTVGIQHRLQLLFVQPFARYGVESCGKARIVLRAQAKSGSHGVAAETLDQTRMPGIDNGQRVADMKAGNGTRRTAQMIGIILASGCERDHRTMQSFFQLGSDQPHHSGVPAGFEQRDTYGLGVDVRGGGHHHFRFGNHRRLQIASLLINRTQQFGIVTRLRGIIGKQAFHTQAHIFQSTCRI